MCNFLARVLSDTKMACQPSALGASAGRGPGSRGPSRKASRPSGFDPSRGHESLAGGTRFGSRRHFIPASLSLPLCGCLLNRSRDCSRPASRRGSPRRRYADAPAAASFSRLRFASARFRQSPVGGDEIGGYQHSAAAHFLGRNFATWLINSPF